MGALLDVETLRATVYLPRQKRSMSISQASCTSCTTAGTAACGAAPSHAALLCWVPRPLAWLCKQRSSSCGSATQAPLASKPPIVACWQRAWWWGQPQRHL